MTADTISLLETAKCFQCEGQKSKAHLYRNTYMHISTFYGYVLASFQNKKEAVNALAHYFGSIISNMLSFHQVNH